MSNLCQIYVKSMSNINIDKKHQKYMKTDLKVEGNVFCGNCGKRGERNNMNSRHFGEGKCERRLLQRGEYPPNPC